MTEKGNATVIVESLVRRVVNAWITTHAPEPELTIRPPLHNRDREHMGKALTRAQRRLTKVARELALVRKVRVPKLNAPPTQTVSSVTAGAG